MLSLTLPLAMLATLASMAGLETRISDPRLARSATYLVHLLQALPFLALAFLFIIDDQSYLYVIKYGSAEMPLKYRISALWAAREGPILLWAGWMGLVSALGCIGTETGKQRMTRLLMNGWALTLLLIAASMNPFERIPENTSVFGLGLNPLLQTDLMVIHPPLIFLFYSVCLLIGAITLSEMFCREGQWDAKAFLEQIRAPSRWAFGIGTLGIGLGGLWAYTVLDWGGYWAWDPVETASMLPWIGVMVLLHLRLKPGRVPRELCLLAGLIPAWFAVMATTVTRAGGVWAASVHSFVIASGGAVPEGVWGRLMLLRTDGAAGVEVMVYLLLMLGIYSAYAAHVLGSRLPQSHSASRYTPWALAVIPLGPALLALGLMERQDGTVREVWEVIPIWIPILLVCLLPPLLVLGSNLAELARRLRSEPAGGLLLLGMLGTTVWLGDPILGGVLLLAALLTVATEDGRADWRWMVIGVAALLFASWANIIEVIPAGVGILFMLSPWLIAKQPEEEEQGRPANLGKLVLWAPLVLLPAYLLLAWMILLNSIDGVQFEAHELYGAPLILVMLSAMTAYGWLTRIPRERILPLLFGTILLSLLLAWTLGDSLPADSSAELAGPFIRGHLVWFLLPMTLLALPAIGGLLLGGLSRLRESRSENRRGSSAWRTAAAHTIHAGLILLLIGHLFATTLVDRTDASHQVSLFVDTPVEYGSLSYTFRELVMLNSSEDEFDARFDVGDGYIGAVIDVSGDDGVITTIEPGMLRFDQTWQSFPRSEVDRIVRSTGDVIIVFDFSQSQAMQQMAQSDLESVDRVRVTIYELPGSHLVWAGWSLMLLGSSMLIAHRKP